MKIKQFVSGISNYVAKTWVLINWAAVWYDEKREEIKIAGDILELICLLLE